MEQNLHSSEPYDYRQYDRVWQRVAPNLAPYPGWQAGTDLAELSSAAGGGAQPRGNGAAVPASPAQTPALTAEGQLPGAEPLPCCMGTAAAESLEVLQGFIETELADRRYYLAFAKQAPAWARQRLRDLAAEAGSHARRLLAVYYLITGGCYAVPMECGRIWIEPWCAALRGRYHAEACNALNYIRAAEGTTDPCLVRLLTELSQEEYRQADLLLEMLEQAMRPC